MSGLGNITGQHSGACKAHLPLNRHVLHLQDEDNEGEGMEGEYDDEGEEEEDEDEDGEGPEEDFDGLEDIRGQLDPDDVVFVSPPIPFTASCSATMSSLHATSTDVSRQLADIFSTLLFCTRKGYYVQ